MVSTGEIEEMVEIYVQKGGLFLDSIVVDRVILSEIFQDCQNRRPEGSCKYWRNILLRL